MIGREQYPPRGPLDNPMFASGPENPRRTFQIFGIQLLNYLQYFEWHWAAAVQEASGGEVPVGGRLWREAVAHYLVTTTRIASVLAKICATASELAARPCP